MSRPRQIAVAVVGLGFGANHARVLSHMPGVKLTVCDLEPARLQVAGIAGAPAYADYQTMLERERPDAVVVAVPTRLHVEVALAAIDAGAGVLVEKPLASSLAEGRRLTRAAAQAGVVLMPGHIERFNPAVQALALCVRGDKVGRVLQIGARRLAYFVPRARDVDVGVVHDLAYHDIDTLRHIDGSEVERVFAETQRDVHTPYDDSLSAVLRFESGVIGTLEVNWLSPRKVRELSVLGERGALLAEYADFRSPRLEYQPSQTLQETPGPGEAALVRVRGDEPPPPRRIPVEPLEPLQEELAAFVLAVRDRTPPPVTAADALATLAVADALTESARTGLPVLPSRA